MKQWLQKHSVAVSLLPVLAVMGLIFWFSAQTGASSGALSGRITARVVRFFVPDIETFSETERQALYRTVGTLIRKGAHFTEFALLGITLRCHLQQLRKRIRISYLWLWAWGIGTAYAITDELHQGFVGGRHPAVTDVLIDSSGVITGVLLMAGILWLWHRKRRRSR